MDVFFAGQPLTCNLTDVVSESVDVNGEWDKTIEGLENVLHTYKL